MSGTILENLSNRKLIVVLIIILIIQFISFLIGAFLAPAPANTEQVVAIKCIPNNYSQVSIPRHIQDPHIIPKNCIPYHVGEVTEKPIVFAFQLPLPREGYVLDYSRWMSNLIALLTPDLSYKSYKTHEPSAEVDVRSIKCDIILKVTLAAKDAGDEEWKIISQIDALKRNFDCNINTQHLEDGQQYDCNLIQLFELQSLFYDYYLINIQFMSSPEITHAELTDLNLVAIHQNGGFTKVWLSLKSVFFVITLFTLIWYWNRLSQLTRKTTLLERTIIMLGLAITQLNVPLEFLSLFYDLGFMNFFSDIRQGIFYCALFSFWCIFTGEHQLDGVHRSRLSSYCKQLSIVLAASTACFLFDSIERGIQWINPFFTIWEVDSHLALIFIIIASISAAAYFIFLLYQVRMVYLNLSSKQSSLPSMSSTRRLIYQGIIYRFKFLLWLTIICAGATLTAYIMSQFTDESYHWEEDSHFHNIQWSSALFTSVYAMWNCYTIILLILYAPSHKGLGPNVDALSEEIEFNRLTSDDRNESNGDVSSTKDERERVPNKEDKSDMQLLQELTSKQSID